MAAGKKAPDDRAQALRERIKQYECEDRFRAAIDAGNRGDIKLLCEFLRSDCPLSNEGRQDMAALLKRQLGLKKRGRPKGPADRSARAMTERLLIGRVKQREAQWRRRNPAK